MTGQITSVQTVPDREVPRLRTDWLIPVESRMNAELDRMGFSGPNLLEHPGLANPRELVRHLLEIGLGASDRQSL